MVEITPLAEPLASDHPDSVRQFAIMVNEEVYQAFDGLIDSVRTGKPSFDDRFGMPVFTYYDAHPDVAATFHSAMNDWSAWDTPGIIAAYDFGRFKKVVDVGGGNGQFLSALLSRHPQLSGVLFDRPAAIAAARAGEGGPLLRCELVEGDFTIGGVPAGADLYTIKHVIDGWSDDGAAEVLATIRQAMADDGRVLVLDCVVADDNDASFVKWLDLLVMTTTQGRMRKVSDYPPIFAKAGLKLGRVIRVSDSVSILEGLVRKAR
jgi:SAM-dependent methyltransferase